MATHQLDELSVSCHQLPLNGPLLQIRDLSKSYGGVHALRDVSLQVSLGEVHALCGENGAGKSTLIKILTGAVRPDQGEIQFAGRRLLPGSVTASEQAGIAVMHQESTAFPDLNAIDNLFIGREPTRWPGWLLDRPRMRREAIRVLERLGEAIDLQRPIGELPLAQRQMVAMARALLRDCRLLIMDEPTASLSAKETLVLLRLISQLRNEGVSVLYVSHRLEEVFQISDRVTVLRDGQLVDTTPTTELSTSGLIQRMIGRDVDTTRRRQVSRSSGGRIALNVQRLTRSGVFCNVSFAVREGEIVGLAGLVGAGRSEVVRAIFGVDRYDSGVVLVHDRRLAPGSVASAVASGVALVPEDRQHEGLVLPMSVGANLTLAILKRLQRFGFVQPRRERQVIDWQLEHLQIRSAGRQAAAATLSGGNQQKLVVGKWLASRPRVLIMDEPTRGVDVGAKAQVHRLIRQLAADGIAILVISSELPELLALSDRILVMRQGELAGELPGHTAQQADVLRLALPDGQSLVQWSSSDDGRGAPG
jgi:rhamnose transport system ATP-binding protein